MKRNESVLDTRAYQYVARKIDRGFDIRLYPRTAAIDAYKSGYRAATRDKRRKP